MRKPDNGEPGSVWKDARALNPKYPHLISAGFALLVAIGLLAYEGVYARSAERTYVHALAPLLLPESSMGSALQQAAFQQPDLLVIYGSSEMLVGETPYRAYRFFQDYPTGFNVFEVAKAGATSLDIAQDLAAIGPELRGKNVVFSFTPSMFIHTEVDPMAYAADFSRLHASSLIFSPWLSLRTKEMAAERMNEYPDTLRSDPVLGFAVGQLACGCSYGQYLYSLAYPLGQLDTWILRLQDHWAVLSYIWNQPNLTPVVERRPSKIDWASLIEKAVKVEKIYSNSNPYGIENELWNKSYANLLAVRQEPGAADALLRHYLNNSKEWVDFDLALQVLKESGAKPLILSRPIDGPIWSAMGVSWEARQEYYARVRKMVSAYGFAFVDFANHDGDPYFSYDQASHTSGEGWVYVDRALDGFYHGTLH